MPPSSISVSELYVYPIKSCRGISLERAQIGSRGIQRDREFMLVDPLGRFITQRQQPRMALIETEIRADGILSVKAPNMPELVIVGNNQGERFEVGIWRDTCIGIDQGYTIAEWFSTFLGVPCRLVRMPEHYVRRVNPHYARSAQDQVGFADGYPFLLIAESSLADLNARLQQPLPINRFRPNIVLKGTLPYAEDTWRKIRIGEMIFHVVKPCARCPITTTDQATAARSKEPLRTLATYRRAQKGVIFGQNLIHIGEGIIRPGDPVEILKQVSTPNFVPRGVEKGSIVI